MKKIALILVLSIVFSSLSFSQEEHKIADHKTTVESHDKMQWFGSAKLGIFIHWGLYAVNGISESWSFYNGHISHKDYLKQSKGFTASQYQPEEWAKLIKESGAKYSVITSRHHDGFALWNTQYGKLNAVKHSAAKRDVLSPFISALREEGLKVGMYYSLPDWSHPDYTDFTRKEKRYKAEDEPKRWAKYLTYMNAQMTELQNQYNPDLWWFDGDWEHNDEEWQADAIKKKLLDFNPNTIINSRLRNKGDYETPELGIPVQRPEAQYWELCQTMNDSWGYYPTDTNYKSPQEVIDILVDCISKGGNLLLDIGPKADGTIAEEQVNILKQLGRWTQKHEEAIYQTKAGIAYDHFYGPSSLSPDSSTLYLYVRDLPRDGQVALKGVSSLIKNARVVGSNNKLEFKTYSKVSWNDYPGVTYIKIPKLLDDPNYIVLAIEFNKPIQLYTKIVGAIESN